MRTALKIFFGFVGVCVAAVVLFFIYARFHDGPIAIVAGGPFTSGEIYSGPEPDWSEMRTRPEVEFQLLEPARSRVTWIAEHDGKPYIVSGYMNTSVGKLWKQWPHEALEDGRAVLRIDGKRYPVRAVRVTDPKLLEEVGAAISKKYLDGSASGIGNGWLFLMDPRTGHTPTDASVEPIKSEGLPA